MSLTDAMREALTELAGSPYPTSVTYRTPHGNKMHVCGELHLPADSFFVEVDFGSSSAKAVVRLDRIERAVTAEGTTPSAPSRVKEPS